MNSKQTLPPAMLLVACALGQLCSVIEDKKLATDVLEDCIRFMRVGFNGEAKVMTAKIAAKAVMEAARTMPLAVVAVGGKEQDR